MKSQHSTNSSSKKSLISTSWWELWLKICVHQNNFGMSFGFEIRSYVVAQALIHFSSPPTSAGIEDKCYHSWHGSWTLNSPAWASWVLELELQACKWLLLVPTEL